MLENYGINIYNRDCLEAMREMPDKCFDLAIVDPPYGLDLALNGQFAKYGGKSAWDKSIPTDEYFIELFRISKNQIIWGANYMPIVWRFGGKEFIFWNKLNHHDNRSDGELAFTSFNGLSKYFEYMWDGNRFGFVGNIEGVGKKSERIHPTQKPVALYKWLLDKYAKHGDKILDTHGGSMSIAIACYEYGFNLDLYELDKDYYETGKQRVENYISSHPKLF